MIDSYFCDLLIKEWDSSWIWQDQHSGLISIRVMSFYSLMVQYLMEAKVHHNHVN